MTPIFWANSFGSTSFVGQRWLYQCVTGIEWIYIYFSFKQDDLFVFTFQAKSSADMGHWLGLLLSQTGTKTDPEELTYDYVNSERISSIVNAAKTSM